MPGAKILMYLYVEDVSGVTGVVALGIYSDVAPGVPSVVSLGVPGEVYLWVPGDVALGINGIFSSVFTETFSLGSAICVTG